MEQIIVEKILEKSMPRPVNSEAKIRKIIGE
jgi:hypothetical protein